MEGLKSPVFLRLLLQCHFQDPGIFTIENDSLRMIPGKK